MKTKKRPLITKSDMKKIVSAAKRMRFDGKTVQVQALLREHYPDRPISGQMRRIVSAELDKAGISRLKRVQTTSSQEFLVKTTQKPGKFKLSENFLEDAGQPSDSIPGTLGGIAADDSAVIDLTLPPESKKPIEVGWEYSDQEIARQCSLDNELGRLADKGNYRALGLLMRRLGVR